MDEVISGGFRPTRAMAAAAARGLRLRAKFGRGGTEVGVARAHQLIERRALSPAEVRSMHSYFARHAVDKNTGKHKWNSDTDPSAGFIATVGRGAGQGLGRPPRRAAARGAVRQGRGVAKKPRSSSGGVG